MQAFMKERQPIGQNNDYFFNNYDTKNCWNLTMYLYCIFMKIVIKLPKKRTIDVKCAVHNCDSSSRKCQYKNNKNVNFIIINVYIQPWKMTGSTSHSFPLIIGCSKIASFYPYSVLFLYAEGLSEQVDLSFTWPDLSFNWHIDGAAMVEGCRPYLSFNLHEVYLNWVSPWFYLTWGLLDLSTKWPTRLLNQHNHPWPDL